MAKFQSVLVVTHLAFRKNPPIVPIEGPYSTVAKTLSSMGENVQILGLPLEGFDDKVIYGKWGETRDIQISTVLGKFAPIKYIVDILIVFFVLKKWEFQNRGRTKLVIGIDPLSMLPLLVSRKLFGETYKLVFHCVDFNKTRFSNPFLQSFYESADKWASLYSDQTWVICQSLKDYKMKTYGVRSHYVPNSVMFDRSIFENGKKKRTGNKMIWTGGLFTDRQFKILFGTLDYIQKEIRPEMRFVIAPTRDHEKFKKYAKKYMLKNTKILTLTSRAEFQKVAATCDVGIALYDEQFGSTQFIEPMKIWDFMLCGLPFIVSAEPSISKPVLEGGVAYRLNEHNVIPDERSLSRFLSKSNLVRLARPCLKLAERFDVQKQLASRLKSVAVR